MLSDEISKKQKVNERNIFLVLMTVKLCLFSLSLSFSLHACFAIKYIFTAGIRHVTCKEHHVRNRLSQLLDIGLQQGLSQLLDIVLQQGLSQLLDIVLQQGLSQLLDIVLQQGLSQLLDIVLQQ